MHFEIQIQKFQICSKVVVYVDRQTDKPIPIKVHPLNNFKWRPGTRKYVCSDNLVFPFKRKSCRKFETISEIQIDIRPQMQVILLHIIISHLLQCLAWRMRGN